MKSYHSRQLPTAFLLGFQIEELYSIFGESLIQVFQSASEEYMESFYHKFVLIDQCIEDLNLETQFTSLSPFIKEQVSAMRSIQSKDPAAMRAQFDVSRTISNKLDELMNGLAAKLNPADKTRFDLGIFIARISLCCRVLKLGNSERQQLYVKELGRVKKYYLDILQKGKENGVMEAAFPGTIRSRFDSIAVELENSDFLDTPRSVAAIHTQVEILLDDMGFSTTSTD